VRICHHQAAVQELMVHVHQVLVHERIVAVHRAAEAARLIVPVGGRVQLGAAVASWPTPPRRGTRRSIPAAPARIGAHAIGQLFPAHIRTADAASGAVIGPAVITAAQGFARDHTGMQRHLPMRAAILKRE